MKPWSAQQIRQHIETARLLKRVKDETILFLKKNQSVSEYEAVRFIQSRYAAHSLKTDHPPIVAFRENTRFVHYFPSQYCLRLKPRSLILIDIWARLNKPGAPFADVTWMAHHGPVPLAIQKIFSLVTKARDEAVRYLRSASRHKQLPTGRELDAAARDVIKAVGLGNRFLHSTGHILGFTSPHGAARPISPRNQQSIAAGFGYTIEPGIYLEKTFGVRSEIDVMISRAYQITITTPVQKKITLI